MFRSEAPPIPWAKTMLRSPDLELQDHDAGLVLLDLDGSHYALGPTVRADLIAQPAEADIGKWVI